MNVNEWKDNRTLQSCHVMLELGTQVRHYMYYGPEDFSGEEGEKAWEEEFSAKRDQYREIPYEEWTAEDIAEVLGSCMENRNMHRCLYWPGLVLESIKGLSMESQREVMRNVMGIMLEEYLN